MRNTRAGFTLIELLVVITILVVLLALLSPALDQAMYQAELATCQAKLDAAASGVITYAMNNARQYPYRPTLREAARWQRPELLMTQEAKDDRPYVRAALGALNASLLDPLAGKIDLEHNYPPTDTFANYCMWFGYRLTHPTLGGKGMYKLGDRFEWTDESRGDSSKQRFSALISDADVYYNLPGTYKMWATHPDADGVAFFGKFQQVSQRLVLSWWTSTDAMRPRGTIETNYAFADGSVERYNAVAWDDDRMARLPQAANGAQWDGITNYYHIPRR